MIHDIRIYPCVTNLPPKVKHKQVVAPSLLLRLSSSVRSPIVGICLERAAGDQEDEYYRPPREANQPFGEYNQRG